MKAVILAAGLGTRLGGGPKPLVKVGGIEILLRTMKLLSPYVSEFIIVASIYAKDIDRFLQGKGFRYRMVVNSNPERGNGYSLYLTKGMVGEKFILVMGDHIYSEDFVREAVKGEGLIGDRTPRFIDIDEATKVKVVCEERCRVAEIGKEVEGYDCIDTGFFILTSEVFRAAERLLKREEISLSDIIRESKPPVTFVDGKLWMDVDTKEDVKRANRLLVKHAVKTSGDGFISRHLNRRISTKISAMIVNRATPNQMTVVSFIVGVLASVLLFISVPLAGFIYQISSILDGCDGEIARVSMRQSKLGGYVDSILDRFVDFLFLAILALLYPQFQSAAIFAIFGSVMVSYSTEKYKSEFCESIYGKIKLMNYLPGKRDERIFLIMLFCFLSLLGEFWIYCMFWLIAVLSIARVVATLAIVIRSFQPPSLSAIS